MKKLLLITYYFPPSGGPGVQRGLKFAKYLPALGWEPTVLTVEPEAAAYPDLDPTLLEEVAPDLRVERTHAWDPYSFYARLMGKEKSASVGVNFITGAEGHWKERLARWLRANVFLPDARVGWVPYAFKRGRRLLEREKFDAVLTSGPPHSTHLVGRALARRYAVPWVADFRDPWTDIAYYDTLPLTALARWIDAGLEKSVLREADAVLTVSPALQQILAAKTPREVAVVYNGFDETDFDRMAPAEETRFVLSHTGNLSGMQNPETLWRVLGGLRAAGKLPELRIRLTGNVDPSVERDLSRYGLSPLVERIAYVPHGEAVRQMVSSSLLLLAINRVPKAEGIVTGKLYEYLAAGRPILGVGPVPGDAATILAETGAGTLFHYDDAEGMARFLSEHYEAWASGRPRRGAAPEQAARYSRRCQTGELVSLLDRLLAGRTAPAAR